MSLLYRHLDSISICSSVSTGFFQEDIRHIKLRISKYNGKGQMPGQEGQEAEEAGQEPEAEFKG